MRNLLLVLLFVGLAACEDEVLPTKPEAAVRKPVLVKSTVAMPRVDTTKSSSICKASVRAGGRLKARLDAAAEDAQQPSLKARPDAEAETAQLQRRAVAYVALIADACK